MYRTLFGLIATVAAALLLAGLSFSASVGKPADLRFVNGTETDTLDPHLLTGQPGGRIVTAIFEGLTRYDERTLGPAPGVATHWEISDDGRRYTFHLREDSRWSDGTPVTAEDFIYSWRRMLDPALGAEYAYMLHPIEGAKALNTFEGLAHTIEQVLLPRLKDELARSPGGLNQEAWHALTVELPLHDSLQHAEAPELRRLLDAPPASIDGARLASFIAALGGEAARLRQSAADVASRFGKTLGVYAPDPHTLVVELAAPTPYFLDITSFYSALPVPRHVVERPGMGSAWFLPETVVCNGPFVLEHWRVNDRIRLRRNEQYWGKDEVRSEIIEALPTENATTALNLYLTGEVDWLPSNYPTDLVEQLRPRSDFYVHAAFTVYYYRFNTTKPPLDDRRVREALNLAIDRDVIVRDVLGLGQLPATHFVPPGVPGYEPPETGVRLDVARARKLLAEAGYPEGRGFPAVGVLFNTSEGHKKIAEVVADQLKTNLGITVTPYNQEWQSYLASTRSGNFEISRAAWIGDYLDPNTFLDMWVTNGGNNQTGFSSPVYDSIIRAAADMDGFARSPDALLARLTRPQPIRELLEQRTRTEGVNERLTLLRRARMLLLGEAEAILVQQEFPIMPVYYYVDSGLRAPGLRGLYTELELDDGRRVPNLQSIHPLRALWVDRSSPLSKQ
jgi:oligopeptide transport system substrate-binding protein